MDLSIEAIENDLIQAESRAGQPAMHVYLKRAEIRAILMSMPQPIEGQFGTEEEIMLPFPQAPTIIEENVRIGEGEYGSTYVVPKAATYRDRIEAAAHMLGVETYSLELLLNPLKGQPDPGPQLTVEALPTLEIDEDDVDEDFFAEARKGHKK